MVRNNEEKPLRICLLASVFWPIYPGQGGRHAFVIGEILAKLGYDVTVVTTYPLNKGNFSGKNRGFTSEEHVKGMKLIRVPSFLSKNPSFMHKLLFYISFMFGSLFALPKVRSADIVIGLHPPPPYLFFPGALFSRLLQSKYVIRVTDIWPDVLFEHFNWPRSQIGRGIVHLYVKKVLNFPDHIMAFTPQIRDRLMKDGVSSDKLSTIEIAVDSSLFCPMSDSIKKLSDEEYALFDENFVVFYSGAFTFSYDFDLFLKSAKMLEKYEDLRFVLLGDGAAKNQIEQKIDDLEVENVVLLPAVSQADQVATYINCSDVCTVPMRGVAADTMTRPSKTFEFWSCQKPVVSSSIGELPSLISESESGIATEPGNCADFAQAIERLYKDRALTKKMGENGRSFVKNRFSYTILGKNLTDMVDKVVQK